MIATITYRPNAQKTPGLYDTILTDAILKDICQRITGQNRYRVVRDLSTYNKGRLVLVEYHNVIYYVSLSEISIEGRNSSLQSVPTAINLYYADIRPNKQLCYYFMPHNGNAFTDYHIFIYKLLMTAGVRFLNIEQIHWFMRIRHTALHSVSIMMGNEVLKDGLSVTSRISVFF